MRNGVCAAKFRVSFLARMSCSLVFSVTLATAGHTQTPDLASVNQSVAPSSSYYTVRSGDELEFQFFYNPELNQRLVVRPDGFVSLPLLGEVRASGLGVSTLMQTLTSRYETQLQHPEVNIVVRSFAQDRVFVDGEVGHPGMQSLQSGKTVLQALSEAGGTKETGLLSEVRIIREVNGKPVVLTADVKSLMRHKAAAEDIHLRANDILYVPRTRIANVNLWVDQYLRKNIPITFGLLSNGLL